MPLFRKIWHFIKSPFAKKPKKFVPRAKANGEKPPEQEKPGHPKLDIEKLEER